MKAGVSLAAVLVLVLVFIHETSFRGKLLPCLSGECDHGALSSQMSQDMVGL